MCAELPVRGLAEALRSAQRSGSDFEDALLLRNVLETGAAEAAAASALSQGERMHLRERLDQFAAAELGDYRRTRGCTSRSPRSPARRR